MTQDADGQLHATTQVFITRTVDATDEHPRRVYGVVARTPEHEQRLAATAGPETGPPRAFAAGDPGRDSPANPDEMPPRSGDQAGGKSTAKLIETVVVDRSDTSPAAAAHARRGETLEEGVLNLGSGAR